MALDHARFDWYQATFEHSDHEGVATSVALALGARVGPGRALYGYAAASTVELDDRVLCTVFGRSSRVGEVHLQASGEPCDVVVPLVRRLWPDHRVSRVDSALDFAASFAAIDASALEFAEERGLRHRLVTDSEGGATRYLGSPSSEVMVRIYKKSEQLRALHPNQADEIPDGIVRAECQVRPGKRPAKEAAGVAPAADIWGFGQWSKDLGERVLGLDALRSATHFRRESDWGRALFYVGKQYGPMVAARAAERGGEAVAREVLAALGLKGALDG